MDSETLFYICGGVLAVSAVVVTLVGLKVSSFPGRAMPLVIIWFAVFVVGASTFAVRYSAAEQEHKAAELEEANKLIEEGESGGYGNEGGALGGEREEGEEEAEEAAEGSVQGEEEPVGPTEGSQQGTKGQGGGSEGGSEAAATTLQLAADPTALAFDETELSAKAGKVTIDFDNPSAAPHNVVILKDGEELAGFEPITEGEEELSAELESGTYEFICSVPGHAEAGMKGSLTVE